MFIYYSQVYILEVGWSDHSTHLIVRKYSDFYNVQVTSINHKPDNFISYSFMYSSALGGICMQFYYQCLLSASLIYVLKPN